jgi:hypothetical protein
MVALQLQLQKKRMTRSHSKAVYTWQDDDEQVERVYCLAKKVWAKRHKPTPTRGMTWGEWFREHSGMSLHEFSDWANDHKLREKWNQSVKKSG